MIKKKEEIYWEIPQISLNDYLKIVEGHISFGVLRNLFSVDCIKLYGYFKISNKDINTLVFDSGLEYDTLSLYDKKFPFQKNKEPLINRQFLIDSAANKIGKNKINNYVFFKQMPDHLINSFVCTEDPLFWNHKGISPHFIGYAIKSNIKDRKIVRGASTITMQLTRNLFLNHKRNFLRKIEESIIALLIENYYSIDKSTIIEVYVNMIEFAPNVFGIYEASLFYFGKNIRELSLTEILVLTYIIPRPIHFYNALKEKTKQLKKNLYIHLTFYSKVMLKKGVITQDELLGVDYTINFSKKFGELKLN